MGEDSQEAVFLHKEPCPSCGSKDNLARYSDGHGWCFGCGHYEKGDGSEPAPSRKRKMAADLITGGEYQALAKRKLTEETCRKFHYKVGEFKDRPCQIANYYTPDGTEVVAQKIRFPNKDFTVTGKMGEAGLYGQHLWRESGKYVTICEGEIDAMTVSQLMGHKWPVVSIPNGAQGAAKSCAKHLEWLSSFEFVVLYFDNDEAGRAAAEETAALFSPGKVKIARMQEYKDPNEALQAGNGEAVMKAFWDAKVFRPDGIVPGNDLWETLTGDDDVVQTVPYPWDGLNEMTRGLRRRELVTLTSGSGMGKSALARELAYHLIREGEVVGMMMLEEDTKRTAKGLMGIELNEPIHLDLTPWSELTDQEKERRRYAYEATVGCGRVFLYDHFGSTEVENLMNRVRFLAKGCGCNWIILDHLSIVVSGLDDGDERKTIDRVMTMLRTLVQETGVGMVMISHLKRPPGDKGHEQGAVTSLSQLRGSHAIAQLSDMVIGMERDQQSEKSRDVSAVRILKNRFSGQTGIACHLKYDHQTGRLSECNPAFEEAKAGASVDEDCPF